MEKNFAWISLAIVFIVFLTLGAAGENSYSPTPNDDSAPSYYQAPALALTVLASPSHTSPSTSAAPSTSAYSPQTPNESVPANPAPASSGNGSSSPADTRLSSSQEQGHGTPVAICGNNICENGEVIICSIDCAKALPQGEGATSPGPENQGNGSKSQGPSPTAASALATSPGSGGTGAGSQGQSAAAKEAGTSPFASPSQQALAGNGALPGAGADYSSPSPSPFIDKIPAMIADFPFTIFPLPTPILALGKILNNGISLLLANTQGKGVEISKQNTGSPNAKVPATGTAKIPSIPTRVNPAVRPTPPTLWEGQEIANTSICSDSDNGVFSGKPGAVTFKNADDTTQAVPDYCVTDTLNGGTPATRTVDSTVEHYCKTPQTDPGAASSSTGDSAYGWIKISCPGGCDKATGACKPNPFAGMTKQEIAKAKNICEGYSEAAIKLSEFKPGATGGARAASAGKTGLPDTSQAERSAGQLTNELLGMPEFAPGAIQTTTAAGAAKASEATIAKAKERKAIMMELAATNPPAFLKYSIAGRAPRNTDPELAKEIESDATLTGNIMVTITESPHFGEEYAGGDGQAKEPLTYQLNTAKMRYAISATDYSRLPAVSGKRMEIKGVAIGNIVVMDSSKSTGIALKSTTTPNENIGPKKFLLVYSHRPGEQQKYMINQDAILANVKKFFQDTTPLDPSFQVMEFEISDYDFYNLGGWGYISPDKTYTSSEKQLALIEEKGINLKDVFAIINVDERVKGQPMGNGTYFGYCNGGTACGTLGKVDVDAGKFSNIQHYTLGEIYITPNIMRGAVALNSNTIIHEIGHNMGANHSLGAHTNSGAGCVIGQYYAYGTGFGNCQLAGGSFEMVDPMGSVYTGLDSGSYTVANQITFGWLTNNNARKVETVTKSGIYTLNNIDSKQGIVALKIPLGTDETTGNPISYTIEYREKKGYNNGYDTVGSLNLPATDVYDGPILYLSGQTYTDNPNAIDNLLIHFQTRNEETANKTGAERKIAILEDRPFYDLENNLAIKALNKTDGSVRIEVALNANCGEYSSTASQANKPANPNVN